MGGAGSSLGRGGTSGGVSPSIDETEPSEPDGVSSGDVLGDEHWIASTSFSLMIAVARSFRFCSEPCGDALSDDAADGNIDMRWFQTSLISLSSKSRQVGMMVSSWYDHTTRTRSSRCHVGNGLEHDLR